jgi:hypothetical protein
VNVRTWLEIGLASRKPIPTNVRKNATYTISTARPRGIRGRCTNATTGLRISAMTAATTKISSTFPAAFASAHSANSATGSSTSCTHRGTIARGGSARGGSTGESGTASRLSSLGRSERDGLPDRPALTGVGVGVPSVGPLICVLPPASGKYG